MEQPRMVGGQAVQTARNATERHELPRLGAIGNGADAIEINEKLLKTNMLRIRKSQAAPNAKQNGARKDGLRSGEVFEDELRLQPQDKCKW